MDMTEPIKTSEIHGIFLDRDGVINKERADYVKSWDEFVFLPDVFSALSELAGLELPTFIATNQSVIGRQIVTRADVDEIHLSMLEAIGETGLGIREIFLCPHHPKDGCNCRKPASGMLTSAAEKYDLDITKCLFIGDSITDYQAARNCGCGAILLRSGRQGQKIDGLLRSDQANYDAEATADVPIFDDLSAAARYLGDRLRS